MSKNSNHRLAGRTAIVTGSGRGIGAAIARLFAAEGANVVVSARTGKQVQRVADAISASGGSAYGVTADLASSTGAATLIEAATGHFSGIDILVHNAGIFPYEPLEDMEYESWRRVMAINLDSVFHLSKACLPYLRESTAGRILVTSSVQGNHAALPGCAHYAASKAGVSGFIRAAALEFARYGITVNGVEPGLVLTEGTETAISAERRDQMAASVPLGRWATPKEIAQAMLFLASDEAAYVTGQSMLIDGGATLPVFRA